MLNIRRDLALIPVADIFFSFLACPQAAAEPVL